MFVAASTACFPDLELRDCIERLGDLDFTAVEIILDENGELKPSELIDDMDRAVQLLRHTHRMEISGYEVNLRTTGDEEFERFERLCHLAKLTKVVTLTVNSGEHGTPFNEEVERLKRLVKIGDDEGVRVSVRCELGHLSDDPDTLMVFCNNIEGLGVTLDPSVPIAGGNQSKNADKILPHVCNVHLRDTKPEQFQVSVGQGQVDYAKLITQLEREKYDRALTVHMHPMDDLDHRVELRKLRRLLETLL